MFKKEVLVLVLIFSLSFSAIAVSVPKSEDYCEGQIQCEGLRIKDQDGVVGIKVADIETCRDGNDPGCSNDHGWGWGAQGGYYCDDNEAGELPPDFHPSSGCYIGAVDYDHGDDDVCGWAVVKSGERVYPTSADAKEFELQESITCFGQDCDDGDFENAIVNGLLKWRWYIEPGGICAPDSYWYTCSADNEYKPLEYLPQLTVSPQVCYLY